MRIEDFSEFLSVLEPGSDYQSFGTFDRKSFAVDLNLVDELCQRLTGDEAHLREEFLKLPEAVLAYLTLSHEFTHWYQQIGTAYGYWQLCCDKATYEQVAGFIDSYQRRFPRARLPRPIWSWFVTAWDENQKRFRDHVAGGGTAESWDETRRGIPLAYAVQCFVLPRLVEICEGFAQTSELVSSGPLYGQSWAILANGRLARDVVTSYMNAYMREQDQRMKYLAAVPTVPRYGLFGARELVEGQAQVLEAMLLNQFQLQFGHETFGSSGEILFGPREGVPVLYTIAVSVYANRAARRAQLTKDDLNTFLAIVDFALATPLHPIFGYALDAPPTWRNLHPGWRFMRLCDAVSRVGTIGEDSVTLDSDRYEAFIARVATETGWLSPGEMARDFLERFPEVRAEVWEDALFASACELRLQHPTVFVHYLFDEATRSTALRDRLAQPVVRFGDDSVKLAGWAEATQEQRLALTREWLIWADKYRVADAVATGDGPWKDMDLQAHADLNQFLQTHWHLASHRFQD